MQRWQLIFDKQSGSRFMHPQPEGDYVLHSEAQARIETLEAALRGLIARKDVPPFSAEAIEDTRAAWEQARKTLSESAT